MRFRRRPKFTPAQRFMLDLLIADEARYLNQDAPVCMFSDEQEVDDLLAIIKANSKEDDEE